MVITLFILRALSHLLPVKEETIYCQTTPSIIYIIIYNNNDKSLKLWDSSSTPPQTASYIGNTAVTRDGLLPNKAYSFKVFRELRPTCRLLHQRRKPFFSRGQIQRRGSWIALVLLNWSYSGSIAVRKRSFCVVVTRRGGNYCELHQWYAHILDAYPCRIPHSEFRCTSSNY